MIFRRKIRGKDYEWDIRNGDTYFIRLDDDDVMTYGYVLAPRDGRLYVRTILNKPYERWSDVKPIGEWPATGEK